VSNAKVLIVEDDPAVLAALNEFLVGEGYSVLQAESLLSAYRTIEHSRPDVIITDFQLPDGDALQFLAALKKMNAPVPCIVLTGYGSIDLAVRAIKEGAEQFLTKPVQFSALSSLVRGIFEHHQTKRRHLAHRMQRSRYEKDPFKGISDQIRRLEEKAHRILTVDRPVLIQGETGTGKGVMADWLHKHGLRADEAFVDVNCAGLSKELLESELFGYERGAFTGAIGSKQGLIELAHRGILFLDEIGEMDMLVQPKLLKVVESRRFRRLGDVRERSSDIQIIAATNRDLRQAATEQKFREDLYFRISTFPLVIPPLRERREDVPLLADSLLQNLANDLAREKPELSSLALETLKAYSWPGNMRELRNVLERVVLTTDKRTIESEDLGLLQQRPETREPFRSNLTLDEMEREYIVRVLQEEDGKVARAAARLGIPRSTLYQKIKALGLHTESRFTA
jgi:DNA-binding NtrC family response regulator